jgi:O-antigen/teichoic acid export membrane protein
LLGLCLIIVCYLAFFGLRDSIFGGVPIELTPLVFGMIPFALFQKYTLYTLMGREEVSSRNRIVFYPVLVRFTFIVFLMVLLRMQVLGVVLADVGSYLMGFLLSIFFIARWSRIRWRFDVGLFVESVKFGFIPFLALLIMNLNFRADLFLVKYFIDNTAVGLYSLAVSVVDTLGLLPEAIGAVLFARVSNLAEEEANELTPRVCRLSLFICAVGGLVLMGIADFAVPLIYGQAFTGSVRPLMILIPGIVFLQLFVLLHSDLTGRGKAKVTVYIFSGALVVNLILNYLWIPRFGINGAAAASSVSYTGGSLFLAWTFSRFMNIEFYKLLVLTKGDIMDSWFFMLGRVKMWFAGGRSEK